MCVSVYMCCTHGVLGDADLQCIVAVNEVLDVLHVSVSARLEQLTDRQTHIYGHMPHYHLVTITISNGVLGWLGSRVVSVLDSGAEWPGFKSQPRRCRVTVLGKLFTPIVPLFTKQ